MMERVERQNFTMQKIGFAEALDQIVAEDARFDKEAYLFLRDALDFTIKSRKKQKSDLSRHVTGPELLEGVRQYAIQEFGPMVPTVFDTWRVKECSDVGHMVFNLIRAGIFGKTETDTIDDFKGCYDFHDAFVKPYLPEKPVPPASSVSLPAPKRRKGAAAAKPQ
jgi:uncharacterized repeat protein (TIGR04138 family)